MESEKAAQKFEDLFGQKQLQKIFKKLSKYSYHEMASLFRQVQSTNQDEWLSYLKTLKKREKIRQLQTKMMWMKEADSFE